MKDNQTTQSVVFQQKFKNLIILDQIFLIISHIINIYIDDIII